MTRTKHLVVALLVVAALAGVVAPAAGQSTATPNLSEKAPYYSNNSTHVANESWMDGRKDATLDNFIHYLTRVGGFIIGDGTAQGGVGSAGALVLGIVVMGIVASTMTGQAVGPVGGAVVGIMGVAGITAAGIAPSWLYAVMLFCLGLVLTTVIVRALR